VHFASATQQSKNTGHISLKKKKIKIKKKKLNKKMFMV